MQPTVALGGEAAPLNAQVKGACEAPCVAILFRDGGGGREGEEDGIREIVCIICSRNKSSVEAIFELPWCQLKD